MTAKAKPTMASIWAVLSKIDCSGRVKEKNGCSYLSWAWAWQTLMEHYPQATFDFREFDGSCHRRLPDGTASVECTVTIGENSRVMFLAVMTGYKNMAKPDPTSRDICDAKMRCLVKCLGLFGLGFYIYAGEDLPKESTQERGFFEVDSDVAQLWSVGNYAFEIFQEMDDWVYRLKGKHIDDLTDDEKLKLVEFFQSYSNRSDWPESVR